MCRVIGVIVTENLALQNIFQNLGQLSEQVRHAREPQTRLDLLKQMRTLLGDADKIIGDEMGRELKFKLIISEWPAPFSSVRFP